MNKNEQTYTNELQNLMKYMSSVLATEFPTKLITVEYLMLAILDTKYCHANLILDNCLMSENLTELRNIYTDALKKHSNSISNPLPSSGYSEELSNVLQKAEEEAKSVKAPLVGSEHLLLAFLNLDNKFNEGQILQRFHLDYDFIKARCSKQLENDSKSKTQKLLPAKSLTIKAKRKISDIVDDVIPIKSQVNNKAIIVAPQTEFIPKYSTSINEYVKKHQSEIIVERNEEIEKIIKILCRRKKNNAILVGEGGCGKTAIIYGLAAMIEKGLVPDILIDKEIVMLNPMALISGTHFRGMFEERVNGLFDELKRYKKYILFVDDIHTVMKNGTKEKDNDLSGMIGDILNDGEVRVLSTTTFKNYHNTIELNASLERKFQKVIIDSPNTEKACKMVEANKNFYETYHHVQYSRKAISKAVELAERYMTNRALPDSAFDIIDLAGAQASLIDRDPRPIKSIKKRINEITNEKLIALNQGEFEIVESLEKENDVLEADLLDYRRSTKEDDMKVIKINENDIAQIVSEFTQIPVNKLSLDEKKKIAHIDDVLKNSIIGQDEAIENVCKVIKRNKVGLGDKTKTMANLLMVGPTGCGKCVTKDTYITVKNKKTNEVQRLTMAEFIEVLKNYNNK